MSNITGKTGVTFSVSGATLNEIGTISGAEFTEEGSSATNETFMSMKITAPITKVKAGDYLRVNVKTYAYLSDAGETGYIWFGYDPAGGGTHGWTNEHDFGSVRSDITSRSQILIPMRIDI